MEVALILGLLGGLLILAFLANRVFSLTRVPDVVVLMGLGVLLGPGLGLLNAETLGKATNLLGTLAIILVLAHGWVLLVLSAALLAGVVPRAAAAIASVLLLEIVIALAATGLSDTALRDVGVLGLAVCLTGCKNQRLVLRN